MSRFTKRPVESAIASGFLNAGAQADLPLISPVTEINERSVERFSAASGNHRSRERSRHRVTSANAKSVGGLVTISRSVNLPDLFEGRCLSTRDDRVRREPARIWRAPARNRVLRHIDAGESARPERSRIAAEPPPSFFMGHRRRGV
jgi:hypothetical protein